MADHFNRGDLRRLGEGRFGGNKNIDPPHPNTNRELFNDIRKAVGPIIEKAKGKDEFVLGWRMYITTEHYERDWEEKGHGCGCGCGCGE